MLCSLKIKRPDKLLQKRLILLAYSLVMFSLALIGFWIYPQYFIYLNILTLLLGIWCLALTIRTIAAAEEAISYGGFANEILRKDFKIKRIDTPDNEPVIQNDCAKELLRNEPILEFLQNHLSENRQNKSAFYRLKTGCANLVTETVTLALNLDNDKDRIFQQEEWFEITMRPIYLKKTNIFEGRFSIKKIKKETYFFWTLQNITANKNMEEIFQEERKSLHDFLDYLPVGVYTCDKDYNIEYANHGLAKILSTNREEIVSKNIKELIAKNAEIPQQVSFWEGKTFVKTAKNTIEECYISQESFRANKEIKYRGVMVANLPSEQQIKNQMNRAYNQISWLFDFAPVGIVFTNQDGEIQSYNHTMVTFLQTENEKLEGQSIFTFINEEDDIALRKEFYNVYENRVISHSQDVHIKTPKEEKIAMLHILPMNSLHYENESHAEGLVLYMIDATQLKTLEMQFAQAQKMQAMGQLAGGVAHDFNNLLTAMIGFCDLLLQRHGVGDPSFADLIQIKQNANRAAGLVRQLLAFSRKQPLKPKLINVTENFVELSHMLKRILGERIVLKFNHGNDLGFIRVDPVQFSQVIINLAVNAKDAMNGFGTLTITTRTEDLVKPYAFGADIIKPGKFVVIDVKDTGCGIPIENLTRIFEPFFSTKQNVVGSGTGLGLSMVYGIVRQTEGFIKIDSVIGKGTTFSIHLPHFETNMEEEKTSADNTKDIITNKDGTPILTVQEKVTSPVAINQKLIFGLNVSAIDRPHESTEEENTDIRILFTEDEDSVRTFAIRALKKKGYEVVACNSAENAIERLNDDIKFDLLITDMVMPGMSGADLAKIVKEKIPSIKIILASGYSEEIARRELASSQDFEFLAKPFSLGDLTKKVFDVLNKQS